MDCDRERYRPRRLIFKVLEEIVIDEDVEDNDLYGSHSHDLEDCDG